MRKTILAAAIATMATAVQAQEVIQTQISPEGSTYDAATVHGWVEDYFEGTRSMDAGQWASAFAPNAVLDDPVGVPVKTTPEEILAQGEGFVSAFQEIGLYESFVHVVGNEAVAKWQGRGTTPDGVEITFEGINHFTFNEDGQITLLRGFFSPPGQ
ncbi:nuclear transport factor 2 family protein [Jannaschia donghaensis]|uniref:Ketosteroid isomerase-related protein n=1 Tax=Jannaschia donghaensis TaxID=420998 RepID=A0A0M6YLP5_9RHOB|nr:nuclear transport factor 2 family protein [Jannaschia donghaensis]CTQ50759.1 Ketosteroid isomerase-related protein [Jannaschia donghaensis]